MRGRKHFDAKRGDINNQLSIMSHHLSDCYHTAASGQVTREIIHLHEAK